MSSRWQRIRLCENFDGTDTPPTAINFAAITLNPTKYDYLIKPNAEDAGNNAAVILTFNSQAALTSGMSKIKTEEQAILNAALVSPQSYIQSLTTSNIYTKINPADNDKTKAAKISNLALLNAAKSTLAYTYKDIDLFSGDVTGASKTYQIAYLTESTTGTGIKQSVIAND